MSPDTPGSAPTNYAALVAEVASLLDVQPDQLDADDSLFDWGLDSLRLMALLERLRHAGVELSFVELAENASLRFLAERLGLAPEVP